MEDSPVMKAHGLAVAAERFEERGQWARAADTHLQAVEQIRRAQVLTSDNQATETLQLMLSQHERAAQELRRRAQQSHQRAGRAKPQRATTSATVALRASYASLGRDDLRSVPSSVNVMLPRQVIRTGSAQSSTSPAASLPHLPGSVLSEHSGARPPLRTGRLPSGMPSNATSAALSVDKRARLARSSASLPSSSGASSETSHADDSAWDGGASSFMVLPEKNASNDPFDKFWEAVEGLVDRISNPVAFTTAPLYDSEFSESVKQDLALAQASIHQSPIHDRHIDAVSSSLAALDVHRPPPQSEDADIEEDDLDDRLAHEFGMSDSFCFVDRPSTTYSTGRAGMAASSSARDQPATSPIFPESTVRMQKTVEEYAIENRQLKSAVDVLSSRLQALEKVAENQSVLRDQVTQFRDAIKHHARRMRHSQELSRSAVLHRSESSSTGSAAAVPQLQRRVQELEQQIVQLRADNERQATTIEKFKDRWQKLKSSAKRRYDQQQQQQQQEQQEQQKKEILQIPYEELTAASPCSPDTSSSGRGPDIPIEASAVLSANDPASDAAMPDNTLSDSLLGRSNLSSPDTDATPATSSYSLGSLTCQLAAEPTTASPDRRCPTAAADTAS